jgi:hypothetical protein
MLCGLILLVRKYWASTKNVWQQTSTFFNHMFYCMLKCLDWVTDIETKNSRMLQSYISIGFINGNAYEVWFSIANMENAMYVIVNDDNHVPLCQKYFLSSNNL